MENVKTWKKGQIKGLQTEKQMLKSPWSTNRSARLYLYRKGGLLTFTLLAWKMTCLIHLALVEWEAVSPLRKPSGITQRGIQLPKRGRGWKICSTLQHTPCQGCGRISLWIFWSRTKRKRKNETTLGRKEALSLKSAFPLYNTKITLYGIRPLRQR